IKMLDMAFELQPHHWTECRPTAYISRNRRRSSFRLRHRNLLATSGPHILVPIAIRTEKFCIGPEVLYQPSGSLRKHFARLSRQEEHSYLGVANRCRVSRRIDIMSGYGYLPDYGRCRLHRVIFSTGGIGARRPGPRSV